jgi:hypothetical protein
MITTKAKNPDHQARVFCLGSWPEPGLSVIKQGRGSRGHRGNLDRVTIAIRPPPALPILPTWGPQIQPAIRVVTTHPPILANIDHQIPEPIQRSPVTHG